MRHILLFICGTYLFYSTACTTLYNKEDNNIAPISTAKDSVFTAYWHTGKAEVNSYSLEQLRYGQQRKGDAVLVFVTEPFSKKKQVKLDHLADSDDVSIPVLKLNSLQKFHTGIYDYSLMNSVFTPINKAVATIKTTCSIQDWCGQIFTQLNSDYKNNYSIQAFSYFESEGDISKVIKNATLEDAYFNKIRLHPNDLAIDKVDLIPSLFFSRLEHIDLTPKAARVQVKTKGKDRVCVIEYLHLDRTVSITFQGIFPYTIKAWEVSNNGKLYTRAQLKETIYTDYWTKNNTASKFLRDSLKLLY